MKNRIIFSSLLIALSTFLWTGCVKEGPMGPPGYDGYDGNANVIYSNWLSPPAWAYDDINKTWYFDYLSNDIDHDMVEYGAILAYISMPNDISVNTIRPLPAYTYGWDFLIPNYGMIEFTSDAVAFSKPDLSYSFRFILIPSSTLLKSSKLKSTKITDLKKMPYKDVCKLLGIPE